MGTREDNTPHNPEPCICGRCWSPMACSGWGYCRERNMGREPTDWEQAFRRRGAAKRSAAIRARIAALEEEKDKS
ncbi:MAG: hypothetical protein RLZZ129_639 [Verrucomicrobiota bacterium]